MDVNGRVGALLALLAVSLPSAGQLSVLGTDAGARPAHAVVHELLDRFQGGNGSAENRSSAVTGNPDALGLPPIESQLTPSAEAAGVVRVNMKLPGPVCVIGHDRISRNWLAQNRVRLAQLGASCVLVETGNRQDLNALRRIAHPVPVHAIPFDDIARQIGLETIPVLLVGS